MRRIRTHLNYTNVAATLALVFAMTGGAIAATGGFTSGGKLQACVNQEGGLKLLKAGKHCKRGQKTVAWNQSGPVGAKGIAGAPGAPGANGAQGGQGGQGPQGTALAFAHVSAAGILDTAHSKNVSAAKLSASAGIFCLTVTVPVTNVTGTEDVGGSLVGGNVDADLAGQDPVKAIDKFCPADTNAMVITEREGGNQSLAFWVSFN